jgi:GNAT superfamily N-acetyltransferase
MIYKEFIIRPARNEDIHSIKNVVFGVLQEYKLKPSETGQDKDLNNIEQSYLNNDGYFGVAVDMNSNEIVGTFGLYPLSKEICELRKMYLLKHARGKGLGNCILNYVIELAKRKHYTKIALETISPLKEAISLYKQNGFREVTPLEINERVDQAFELKLL